MLVKQEGAVSFDSQVLAHWGFEILYKHHREKGMTVGSNGKRFWNRGSAEDVAGVPSLPHHTTHLVRCQSSGGPLGRLWL